MKTNIKKKWVKALRSGEYAQCKKVLVNDKDEFCCLGVLCDISDKGEWIDPQSRYDGREHWHYEINENDDGWSSLPIIINEWSDIYDHEETILSTMNDRGDSFEQIADYIEKNL